MINKSRAAIAATILLWASAFVGIRAGLGGYSPGGLALLRFLVASVVMALFYFNRPRHYSINWYDKFGLMMVGVVGIGFYNLTLNYGETAVSSGVASFIISQSPVVTTFFAVLFLGEKLTPQRLLGFMVSLIGVVIIAYGEIGEFKLTAGLIYVLAAMVAGSLYSILQKPYLKKYSPIETASYVIWGGTSFLMIFIPQLTHDLHIASLTYTLIVVYLGIFPAALAYLAWSYTLRNLSVSHAVSYLYLLPFITAMLGWLLLGEVPALLSVVGAVIAISGVWLVGRSYQKINRPVTLAPTITTHAGNA